MCDTRFFLLEHRKFLKPSDVLSFLSFKPKKYLFLKKSTSFGHFMSIFVQFPKKMRVQESAKP